MRVPRGVPSASRSRISFSVRWISGFSAVYRVLSCRSLIRKSSRFVSLAVFSRGAASSAPWLSKARISSTKATRLAWASAI